MITKILKNALEKELLVDVVMNDIENDESIIGYIIYVNDFFFTIKEIDKFGYFDGNTTYLISEIKNISLYNWYLENLKIVMENNKSFDKNLRVTIWKKGKLIIPDFAFIKENKKLTMFFFDNGDFELGFLSDYNNDFFTINNIGQDGYDNGITTYKIEKIIGMRYNGLGEQKTIFLYENINRK